MDIWDQLVNDTEQADYQTSKLNKRLDQLTQMGGYDAVHRPQTDRTRIGTTEQAIKGSNPYKERPVGTQVAEKVTTPQQSARPADLPMPSEELSEPSDNPQEESQEGMTPTQKLMTLAGTVLGSMYGLKVAGAAGRKVGSMIAPKIATAAEEIPPIPVAPSAAPTARPADLPMPTDERILQEVEQQSAPLAAKSFDPRNIARQQQQLNNRLFSSLNSQGLTRKLSVQFSGPSNAKVVNILDENGKVLTTARNPDELASVMKNLSSLVPKDANAVKKSAPSVKSTQSAPKVQKKTSTADNIASEAAKASAASTKKSSKPAKKMSNDDLFDKKGNIKKGVKGANGKQVTWQDLSPQERKKK